MDIDLSTSDGNEMLWVGFRFQNDHERDRVWDSFVELPLGCGIFPPNAAVFL